MQGEVGGKQKMGTIDEWGIAAWLHALTMLHHCISDERKEDG